MNLIKVIFLILFCLVFSSHKVMSIEIPYCGKSKSKEIYADRWPRRECAVVGISYEYPKDAESDCNCYSAYIRMNQLSTGLFYIGDRIFKASLKITLKTKDKYKNIADSELDELDKFITSIHTEPDKYKDLQHHMNYYRYDIDLGNGSYIHCEGKNWNNKMLHEIINMTIKS